MENCKIMNLYSLDKKTKHLQSYHVSNSNCNNHIYANYNGDVQ